MNRRTRAISVAHGFVRGISSRSLLSLGTVVLCTLALAAAILGPAFSLAVSNSYLVSRLQGAETVRTGLSWEFRPAAGRSWTPATAVATGDRLVRDRLPRGFRAPTGQLESVRIRVPGNVVGAPMLLARQGACAHLEIEGRCPRRPGEALMLQGDAAYEHVQIGDLVDYGPFGRLRMVGTYVLPGSKTGTPATGYWFDPQRFSSAPWEFNDYNGQLVPRRPAPYLTVPGTFDRLPARQWVVRVDSQLALTPDWTPRMLTQVVSGDALDRARKPASFPAGTLEDASINDLPALSREIATEQATARSSITPAVSSLVLVALALLTRLLLAAGDLRVAELALGSLRGMATRRLWIVGLVEPLALLILALPFGFTLGVGVTTALARAWLIPGLPINVPWTSWLALGLVAGTAIAVAALTVALILRRSLASQLAGVRRPVAKKRIALAATLVLVALAGATLVSTATARSGTPDATDALLPVLLAVVSGLGVTKLVSLVARQTVRRRRPRSLANLIALRSLAGRQEGTLVIVPLCVALAVGVFGAGVYASAAAWRESVAATQAPAATVWATDLPMSKVVDLTRQLDPHGRWLMAAGTVTTTDSNYATLDTTRLARVGLWPDSWTPGHDARDVARILGAGPVPQLRGHRVAVTLTAPDSGGDVTLQVGYRSADGQPRSSFIGPYAAGTSTRTADVACADGCELEGLTIGGPAAGAMPLHGTYLVGPIAVDGHERAGLIEDGGWVPSPRTVTNQALQAAQVQDDRLRITVDSVPGAGVAALTTADIPPLRPVLVGPDVTDLGATGGNGAAVSDTGGHPPVQKALTSASIPFLGTDGVLIDNTMMTHDRATYDNSWTTYVLADHGTPPSLAAELAARGLHVETTHAEVRHRLDSTAYALAMRLYGLAALASLLLALAGLAVSTAVQLPGRRMDAASLRVVGVPSRTLISAISRELGTVLGAAALTGLITGWVAQWCVLRTITLGTVDAHDVPRPVAAIDTSASALAALVAGVVVAAVAAVSALLAVRGAHGYTLRERAR